MKEKFRQFMIGRYGTDGLNQFLSIASIVLLLISLLTRFSLFTWLGLVLLVLWQLTPAVRIFPNVIYMEWLVCIAAYAIAAIVCPAKKAVAVEGN